MDEQAGVRYLLFGASSFIGLQLIDEIGSESALGTYCTNYQPGMRRYDSVTMTVDDLLEPSERYTHAVLLLGDSQPDSCYENSDRSHQLNVTSIVRLVDDLILRGIMPIFISSQFVFDGTKGNYTEEDIAHPILLYGRQKLAVEDHIRLRTDRHLILRLPHVYGRRLNDQTLLTAWLDQIRGGARNLRCATDQRFSPIYVDDVGRAILSLVGNRCTGTYHLAGPEICTRSELLQILLAKIHRQSHVRVKVDGCSINDFSVAEPRPIDVSMVPDKLVRDTNIRLQTPGDICDLILSDYPIEAEIVERKWN